MQDYAKLEVWQRARANAAGIYQVTSVFPKDERFGLTAQMRRSSVSIVSNIAEGAGRASPLDFARFLDIAIGSAAELETQVMVAEDIGIIDPARGRELVRSIRNIRNGINRLRRKLLDI